MAGAPRFESWWGNVERSHVLVMKRADWDAAVGTANVSVNLDITGTRLAGVARDATVVAAVAHSFAPATAEVSIYRNDPKDGTTPINKDDYDVWTDLQQHPNLSQMIATASTSDNPNFRAYCAEHVFLVKRKPGDDHWLEELPQPVKAILKKA
jgi:hypothetical protein